MHAKTVLRRTAREKDQIIEERKAKAAERREGKFDSEGNRLKDTGFQLPEGPL